MQDQTVIFALQLDPALVPAADAPGLMEALSELAPYLEDAGEELTEDQQENFATRGGLFGQSWSGNTEKTEREKRRKGYSSQQLVRKGNLQSQIGQTILLSADSVTTGIDLAEVPYAQRIDTGSEVGHLPPRVLVAITPDMVERLETMLREYIEAIVGHSVPGFSITAQMK